MLHQHQQRRWDLNATKKVHEKELCVAASSSWCLKTESNLQERCKSFNPAVRNAPSYPEALACAASARCVKPPTRTADHRQKKKFGVCLDVSGDVRWEKSVAGGEQAGPARVSTEARDKDPY